MTAQVDTTDWREHLLDKPDQIKRLLENTHRIAVLGIKPNPDAPAYYVPEYAQRAGYEIVPVPVYYQELTEMAGERVYRKLADIPGDIDMVNVFRRRRFDLEVEELLAGRELSGRLDDSGALGFGGTDCGRGQNGSKVSNNPNKR